jgi:hypothetical protein
MVDAYPALLKAIAKVMEGRPQVQTYEVANSTVHKVAAHVTARLMDLPVFAPRN